MRRAMMNGTTGHDARDTWENAMRAIQISAFGGNDVIAINDIPEPQPGPGQVLLRVAAGGVNPVDWKIRDGYMKDIIPFTFPTTLGSEIAGTVVALGEGVTDFAIGDEVHGSTGMIGGFADLAVVSAGVTARKPSNLSLTESAALPIAVATTASVLDAGAIGAGTRLLVHAAAGGVGSIAVQLAKARGAEVTALTSPANFDFVRGLGADHVVDRTTDYESTLGHFDVVLDAYGPEAQARSWKLLKKGGILISLVAPPDQATADAHGVRATMVFGNPNGAALREADALVEAGKVKVTIARTYPAAEIVAALDEVQRGQVRGKIVLEF